MPGRTFTVYRIASPRLEESEGGSCPHDVFTKVYVITIKYNASTFVNRVFVQFSVVNSHLTGGKFVRKKFPSYRYYTGPLILFSNKATQTCWTVKGTTAYRWSGFLGFRIRPERFLFRVRSPISGTFWTSRLWVSRRYLEKLRETNIIVCSNSIFASWTRFYTDRYSDRASFHRVWVVLSLKQMCVHFTARDLVCVLTTLPVFNGLSKERVTPFGCTPTWFLNNQYRFYFLSFFFLLWKQLFSVVKVTRFLYQSTNFVS